MLNKENALVIELLSKSVGWDVAATAYNQK